MPVLEKVDVGGTEKTYANAGDWLTHFSYVEIKEGRFALNTFSVENGPV